MEGKLIKEILDIIHDDKFRYQVDKLVEIDRKILGEKWDEVECAKALDLSLPLGESQKKTAEVFTLTPLPKAKLPTHEFISIFQDCYARIKQVKYKVTKSDVGFIVHLIKMPMEADDFKKIVEYLVHTFEHRTDRKMDFDVKRVIDNLKPASIYNNINLLIAKSKETKTASGWGYGFIKKKGEAK